MSYDTPIFTASLSEAADTTQSTAIPAVTLATEHSNKGWHGFIGQAKIVRALIAHINGAKRTGTSLGYVLLTGNSGYGKSALATSMAEEIGTKVHNVMGGPDYTVKQLDALLIALEPNDLVFLDEAHSLPQDVQERLMAAYDGLSKAKALFNMVFATDRPGLLVTALDRRMGMTFHLGHYSIDELAAICAKCAKTFGVSISAQGRRPLCSCSHGEPRQIQHLVKAFRRIHQGVGQATKEQVRAFLTHEGFDSHGNNPTERQYLAALLKVGVVALNKLPALVGVDARRIEKRIEPRMLELGWIDIGAGGRTLTEAGKKVATSCLLETSPI